MRWNLDVFSVGSPKPHHVFAKIVVSFFAHFASEAWCTVSGSNPHPLSKPWHTFTDFCHVTGPLVSKDCGILNDPAYIASLKDFYIGSTSGCSFNLHQGFAGSHFWLVDSFYPEALYSV